MIPLRRAPRNVAGPVLSRDSEAQLFLTPTDDEDDDEDSDCLDRFGYGRGKRRRSRSKTGASWSPSSSVLTWRVAVLVVAFRCCNALALSTYFSPDEFWQGVEVAHDMAFGRCGTGEPTWEWGEGARIRGYMHPLMFAVVYRALAVLGLDSRLLVIVAPRLLQGVLAAACDLCIAGIAERRHGGAQGRAAAGWALTCSLSSWFLFYCLPRTFSNSLETVLTTAGLWFLYARPADEEDDDNDDNGDIVDEGGDNNGGTASDRPHVAARGVGMGGVGGGARKRGRRKRRLAVGLGGTPRKAALPWGTALCAGFAVAVRPTAAVVWAGVGLGLVLFERGWASPQRLARCLACRVAPAAALVLAVSVLVDRWFYGAWTLPPWNFVRLNLLHGVNELYGVHSWHWYITQGVPAVCGAQLPLLLAGVFVHLRRCRRRAAARQLPTAAERYLSASLFCLAWTVAVLSVSAAHKEFRFLLPLLPLAVVPGAAHALSTLQDHCRRRRQASSSGDSGSGGGGAQWLWQWQWQGALLVAGAVAAVHVVAAAYLSRWHQHGPIGIMDALANHMAEHHAGGRLTQLRHVAVHFLTPCHATPMHSYLHLRQSTGSFTLFGGGDGSAGGLPLCVDLQSLDCSPDLDARGGASRAGTESARFLAAPYEFAAERYDGSAVPDLHGFSAHFRTHTLPEYFVLFSAQLPQLGSFLAGHEFREVARVFHSHVSGDQETDANSDAMLLFHHERGGAY